MASSILKQIYASAPTDLALTRLLTVEIRLPGKTLRYVQDYVEHVFGGQLYEPAPVDIGLPNKDASGTQKLRFAIGVLDGAIYRMVQEVLDSNEVIYIVASEWIVGSPDAPANSTPPMPVEGGAISADGKLQVDASYFDLLNLAFPRERYTAENVPGVMYL